MKIGFAIIASGILLAGCASTGSQTASAPAPRTGPLVKVDHQLVLSTIAESQLPKGACGMILWTLDADRPVPVFRFISGGEGNVVIGGSPMSLALGEASGASGFGVFEKLQFSGAGLASFKVAVEFGSGFDGGSYLQRGLITIENDEGWRSVTPVAGIAGCRG